MLHRVEEGTVVPVVGQDLLTIVDGGRRTLLYPLLAKRLAARLGVSVHNLPRGGELQEVARRFQASSSDVLELYRSLRRIVRQLEPIPVPTPLAQLAKISKFDLYVTTTFDVLMERAVDQERFEGQRQTLAFAYAPSDKQDLPPEFERLTRPAVFHLLGRLSGTPHTYALTREDVLDFTSSLQSRSDDAPRFLFDKLRRSHLLVIGTQFADWLVHLVFDDARGGRVETLAFEEARSLAEAEESPVLFVQHAPGGIRVLRSRGTAAFVNELYRQWSELQPVAGADDPPPPVLQLASSPGMQAGVVLLSAASADRAAAESLRDALDRAGVDAILDLDDVPLAPKWERRLRSALVDCALFVPVVSRRSAEARRRFFLDEWIDAILEAASMAPAGRFVLPVAVDESSPRDGAIPKRLGEEPWERAPGGEPGRDLVQRIVRLQRSYRSASFA